MIIFEIFGSLLDLGDVHELRIVDELSLTLKVRHRSSFFLLLWQQAQESLVVVSLPFSFGLLLSIVALTK